MPRVHVAAHFRTLLARDRILQTSVQHACACAGGRRQGMGLYGRSDTAPRFAWWLCTQLKSKLVTMPLYITVTLLSVFSTQNSIFPIQNSQSCFGVATISRLLKIVGLFRKRALWKRLYSAKETYNWMEPTNRSYPISEAHIAACTNLRLYCTNCQNNSLQRNEGDCECRTRSELCHA